ncbi:Nitroreductase [Monaibacterium marinum]|uniref:Putative NAD(P)H nitroreductase n=1 Tax=Pontivivens marinum TaxID=1690039 RepID=A0A2C9CMK9_9RHOB|nr:nitroreductase [Monaibacterium marinum]SOH92544.1 Nitroreductase [Monaibacterium marinum]
MHLEPRPQVMDFLLTRRSRPSKTLTAPAPSHDALRPILEAAARTPDHGKLEPWRFIVLEGDALTRLADLTRTLGAARAELVEKLDKVVHAFASATQIVAVVASPTPSDKVPQIEQHLSAGAVCLAMVNAALASGWGANWLTGWMAMDAEWLQAGLSLKQDEFVAGFIHLGTETSAPPDRPRPDLSAITQWVAE